LPLVHHLHHCATRWEQELQKEVKSMINIFNSNENAFLVQKQRNSALENDADQLLEQVLNADIFSVIMNALYESGTFMLVDDHSADNDLLKTEIEALKQENEKMRKNNDDVQNKFSKEICQL
jgi:cell division protein FtsB